ncbi:MAG: DHH family phosphoesterase [Thermodesulfobacteriota bacterium]
MTRKAQVLPRSSSMVERLQKLYGLFQGEDRVLIIISADPDAISSAMALKRLLWRRAASVHVARTNVIKRPDNLALVSYLKIHMSPYAEVKLEEFTKLAMVDSQPHHHQVLAGRRFDLVIDHHPLGPQSAVFCDVRPDYGATAAIMTEYLRAAKIAPSRKLATALFYGIKTDTSDFVRQGQIEDMRAFRWLFPRISQNMVSKIENAEITRSALKYFHRALDRVRIRKDTALIYLDRVDNPDTLVMIADFFMKVHDINRSIAAGLFKDHLVVIFRVVGPRKNAGRMATEALSEFGPAGGHRSMARAELPLSNLDPRIFEKDGGVERFLFRRLVRRPENHLDKTAD